MSKNYKSMMFSYLREKNVQRMKAQFPECEDWDELDWYGALVGEVGEYANFRKKFIRGSITEEDFLINAGKELADVQMYLDLLAWYLGVTLSSTNSKVNYANEIFSAFSYLGSAPEILKPLDYLCSNKLKLSCEDTTMKNFRRMLPSPEEALISLDTCKLLILQGDVTTHERMFKITQYSLEMLAYSLEIDLAKEVVDKFNETSMKMPEGSRILMELS